jgi:hypothetical protein
MLSVFVMESVRSDYIERNNQKVMQADLFIEAFGRQLYCPFIFESANMKEIRFIIP